MIRSKACSNGSSSTRKLTLLPATASTLPASTTKGILAYTVRNRRTCEKVASVKLKEILVSLILRRISSSAAADSTPSIGAS